MHSSVRAGERRRPGKALRKRPGSSPPASCEQFRAAQAGLRHSVGTTTSSRGRAGGQHQLLGPPGQRQPQAAERCQEQPLRLGGHIWPCGGSSEDVLVSWASGPVLRSPPSVRFLQEDLAQNDPHGRVCLDGEAQCFQGTEGRVHLALSHAFVEGAYLEVAIGAPRVPEGG